MSHMKLVAARLFSLCIPLRSSFVHSKSDREFSESLVVKLILEDDTFGWGEGCPRIYVTGETLDSSFEYAQRKLLPALSEILERSEIADHSTSVDTFFALKKISNQLCADGREEVAAWNAAKSAVELALIDAVLKRQCQSCAKIFRPQVNAVKYSAVIGARGIDQVMALAQKCRDAGIEQIKVKVGLGDDFARVAAVREIVGDAASIRVDANGAFDVVSTLDLLAKLDPLRIDCIEQPVPRSDILGMIDLTARSSIPIMADESLITECDAITLIENKACNIFNLRISKNGGIFTTLLLAEMARQAGISLQLGCQVGETAILSAAGRHLAAYIPDLLYVEGSYGTLILKEDVAEESLSFGRAGFAELISGDGMGITVCEEVLGKHSTKIVDITF